MKPLVSIIVPIYNAEKFLERCLNSIMAQTLEDFELILVNDGSSDSSGDICDRFAHQDTRVKVHHQANDGVSAARNFGISMATGKYIAMVDADDFINKDMYLRMVKVAEYNQTDLVMCGITEVTSCESHERKYDLPTEHVMLREEIVNRIISSDFGNQNIINSPCDKLYKRSILTENNLLFPTRKRGEDWFFNIKYLQLVESVVYIDEPLYYYCRHDDSTMYQYLPNQYDLWLENRAVRNELIKEYSLNIDMKAYNSIWVEKVLYYLLSDPKCHLRSLFRILRDKEFLYASKNSDNLENPYLNMMRSIHANGFWPILIPVILMIKKFNYIRCQK